MEQGFIKLHRSILNWEWWQDENTRNVFLWLLLNANWEDSRFQGHIISKGSLVTSYPKIAENLNISERNARTAIKHLKMTGEVTVKVTRRFSIVTITNWAKYQCTESSSDSLNDSLNGSQVTVKRQSSDSIKEYKNIRNKENNNIGDKKFTPPNYFEVRDYCLERNNNIDPDAFISFYESKGWMIGKNKMKDWKAAVRTWERNRKEEKKSQTDIYRSYQHGNYDFEALEKETRKPKRQHYDFEAIDKEIREK